MYVRDQALRNAFVETNQLWLPSLAPDPEISDVDKTAPTASTIIIIVFHLPSGSYPSATSGTVPLEVVG